MSDLENLFLAVGFIVVHWSQIEMRASVTTNALYENASMPNRPIRIPKFLAAQFKFQKRCLYDCPELSPIKCSALAIIEESIRQQDLREHFVHSCLTSPVAKNGVFSFTMLEAMETDHKVTEWEFDVRTFPRIAIELSGLLDGWTSLAFEVAQLYEARLVR